MGVYGSKVCYKIIVLFIAMIAGYIAKKSKTLNKDSTKALSAVLANITNPCLIVAGQHIPRETSLLKNAAIIFGISLCVHIFMSVFSHYIFKGVRDYRDRNVYTYGLTFMNCGFMGYPILDAMFPEDGLFYGVIYASVFNLIAWSHGVIVMSSGSNEKVDFKKKLINPSIVSTVISLILFVTNIRLPGVILEGVDMVGDMTFPLSMLIIGSLLGDQKLTKLIKEYKLLLFTILKLAIVPLMMLGVCIFIKDAIGLKIALICITMCAAPTATTTAVAAELYGGNSGLAAKLVGVTTLFCLISMPLMLILAEKIL